MSDKIMSQEDLALLLADTIGNVGLNEFAKEAGVRPTVILGIIYLKEFPAIEVVHALGLNPVWGYQDRELEALK